MKAISSTFGMAHQIQNVVYFPSASRLFYNFVLHNSHFANGVSFHSWRLLSSDAVLRVANMKNLHSHGPEPQLPLGELKTEYFTFAFRNSYLP